MQTDYKQIYKMAAQRHEQSEQLYKDVGNFVFQQLYKEIRRPSKLIIKLRGVGSWVLRRKRMRIIIEMFPLNHEYFQSEGVTEAALFKYESKKEIHEIFIQRLKEYEKYIEERDAIRKIRHVTQTPLQAPDGPSGRFKSS